MNTQLQQLSNQLNGHIYFNQTPFHQGQLMAYATDASMYQEKPLAVAIPKTEEDIKTLIKFATKNKITLIPRAAGTSLAGQVVGNGIVVDISQHFNKIIQVNVAEKWVTVQPGVIRDDLNKYLQPYGVMFGPETSTANRAMIGGMVGNNACGLHSIVWGSTRDHLIEAKVILSDASEALINENTCVYNSTTNNILFDKIKNSVYLLLQNEENVTTINQSFPKQTVVRRNTGYALDALINTVAYSKEISKFNLCKLLAGSEGTLAFITQVKLQLLPLPPKHTALICIHCNSINESLLANTVALQCKPMAAELVDKTILDFTIHHPQFKTKRAFIKGDPKAILMVEFMAATIELVTNKANELIVLLQQHKFGYAYPILFDADAIAAWDIRKAGLGLLRNTTGNEQPVNLIEDGAVAPEDLPAYIQDVQQILTTYNVKAAYYAHAGAGQLHVEPLLHLKTASGVAMAKNILKDTAALIKKYKGALSGEHGDGRLRGEFIEQVMGEKVMQLFYEVKNLFDPNNVFNAGKIVHTPAMDTHLRMQQNKAEPKINTYFNFNQSGGILKMAEKCSGSGDCRRSVVASGVMCPSYMATLNEFDTTRARANILRQFLSNVDDATPFNHDEIKAVMDVCLSCKGCKVECPSGVDITKMKAEFLQQYYAMNGVPFRTKIIANFATQMQWIAHFPSLYNAIIGNRFLQKKLNNLLGFHPNRTIPLVHKTTLHTWFHLQKPLPNTNKTVYFFNDEFTNFIDVGIGKKAIALLQHLGFHVIIPKHVQSGRTFLSMGLVSKAATIAAENIRLLAPLVSEKTPLIGIEPSAILTLRDEYVDVASADLYQQATHLAACTFTIEEFLYHQIKKGNITQQQFTNTTQAIALHVHCYQKVLSNALFTETILSFPKNYTVATIPSGCCGMAGSFGYQKNNYAMAQNVGELILFPYIRKLNNSVIIAAAGTSCRHQIKDGVQKIAKHPVEILYDAVLKNDNPINN